MKLYFKIIILVLLFFIVVLGFMFFYFSIPAKKIPVASRVCFQQNCFMVELATSQAQQELGLMNRTSLDKNSGMYFIFDKENDYPFWMKNTLIPLDMIWISGNPSAGSGQVVFIAENVQPCKVENCPVIDPGVKAKYVLEINAGISAQDGIKIGDVVSVK